MTQIESPLDNPLLKNSCENNTVFTIDTSHFSGSTGARRHSNGGEHGMKARRHSDSRGHKPPRGMSRDRTGDPEVIGKLTRQDTFVLTSPRRASPRTRSAYGIASILEKASQSAGLTDDAKRYIGTHMRLLTEENLKLSGENEQLRLELGESVSLADMEKEIKAVRAQLEKERGKNKMLVQRLKQGDSQDIIWQTGLNNDDSSKNGSQDLQTRSYTPSTLPVIHNNGNELSISEDAPDSGVGLRMTRSFSTSRISSSNNQNKTSGRHNNSTSSRSGIPRLGTPLATTRQGTPSSSRKNGITSAKSGRSDDSSEAEDVSVLQRRIRMYKGQVSTMKLEVERLKDLLTREIGEDAMEVLMAGGQHLGWRGRAEQINSLQATIRLLEAERSPDTDEDLSPKSPLDSSSKMSLSALRRVVDWDGMTDSGVAEDEPSVSSDHRSTSSRRERKSETLKVLEERENNVDTLKRRCKELESMLKAAEVERSRLEELVRLVTSRLSSLEQRTWEAEQSHRTELAKSAHLEKMLERKYIELREQGVNLDGWPTKPGQLGQHLEDVFTADTDTLRFEVQKLREEGRGLRKELSETRDSREEIIRIYSRMSEESRTIINKHHNSERK